MQTREIPREQWIRYFDDFSKVCAQDSEILIIASCLRTESP